MGSDVAHDWNCQLLDEGQLKEWRVRPCACRVRGPIVVAGAHAHSTFAASGGGGKSSETAMALRAAPRVELDERCRWEGVMGKWGQKQGHVFTEV